ncbi:MAG: SusC/RagA family TonB-linked outer membrane protein [Wenyingzhuangia sp.]|uniref:SusC/RagA family TonB-linked outer membrane protein n=1 Tax=Wenyingzhuangia sp. TaxID=1964193 RepID=UPI00321B8E0D
MKINKLNRLVRLLSFILLCFCNVAIAQNKGTAVTAVVVDEQGNPLSNVGVYAPNGVQSFTNDDGEFEIKLLSYETVVIKKEGYESELIKAYDLGGDITLQKSTFLASDDDVIKMGVATKNRREIVGAVSSVNVKDRHVYDNTQWVRDYINGLTLGMRGSSNVRGLGNAVFVIDGVIGRDPNILNMEEVDQITILKDANAVALYGSQARNGVIVINTKRGKVNKKEINVNVRSGIRTAISLPNYLDAATTFELRNEALANDGQDLNLVGFSPELIQNTRSGVNPYKYPDVDLYDYVEPFINTTNIITEFSGGNDDNQYYVNMGWNRSSAWVNLNDDINEGVNRFNVRGNIDFKVNDWITSSLDGIAIVSVNKSSRANILDAATTFRPDAYAPFIPLDLIENSNPIVVGQVQAARQYNNGMLLGTSQEFGANAPVALAIAGGYQSTVFRSTQFNNSINFDLDEIAEGLSAKTYLSFDFYDSYNITLANQFKTYAPEWGEEKVNNFGVDGSRIFGEDLKDLTESVSTNGFVSRFGFYGLVNYDKTFNEDHSFNSTLLAYYNSTNTNDVIQTDIDSHLGFQMAYNFKQKLFVDFSGTYTHSIKLPEGNRGDLSPTIGLAYILSEESFLKDSDFVNYLKVKTSGGIIKSDLGINQYYLYDENYSNTGGRFIWADGSSTQNSNLRQDISQGANPNLGFEERIDLNIGFESYLMNSLWIEANYFNTELDKQLTFLQNQYPSFYGDFRPYDNFNKNLYTGFEIGMNYNKTINDLSLSVGANVLYSQTEAMKRSETYEFDYQNRAGKELSTMFGLVDQGFYAVDDFSLDGDGNYMLNEGLPVPNFGDVQPGDLKYQDQNNDNIIDQDDQVAIGQSSSPWSYGLNLNVKYKAFNLFVLGTGQTGGLGSKLSNSFNNYYAVNGNVKYSDVVLGRWTPETADTATFPRLSNQASQNNFRSSTFWTYDTSYFSINRAQLTYELGDNLCDKLSVEDLSVNVSGSNLFEIAKDRDIRQLRIGTTPLTRNFTLGLRVSF